MSSYDNWKTSTPHKPDEEYAQARMDRMTYQQIIQLAHDMGLFEEITYVDNEGGFHELYEAVFSALCDEYHMGGQ
jgi:hypothetical protein